MALEVRHQAKLLRASELMRSAIKTLSDVDAEIQAVPDGFTPLDPIGIMLSSCINLTAKVVAGEGLDDMVVVQADDDDLPDGMTEGQIIRVPLG